MKHDPLDSGHWSQPNAELGLPGPLECETLVLLRRFIAPILENAASWDDIAASLAEKGYGLTFRAGHLVIMNDQGMGLCTGRDLGVPLREISNRIGRPSIRAHADGQSGELQ